ncbi:WD40 repeat domain-containing protein [Urbifossiella limnaea]|uniref:WD domain, G-beta repeat n=1 Tax=Urbifossiella limnaea TaxID=2528023 RepID=A0A517XMZ1_9BACT|nr:WD40 repeat domain-containing protein [Urbifossiella limnaea]QDU18873.1 WD domain, G-beta repeat [Urbifossiella limnaea]
MNLLTPPPAPASAKAVAEFAGHSSSVAAVAFTPDRSLLVSADRDGTTRVWDLGGAKPGPRGDVPRTGDPVRTLSCAPSSRLVALAADATGGLVRLFDITDKSPAPNVTLRGARGAVLAVAYSADGKLIAGGGEDGTLRLWEPGPGFRGDARAMLTGHTKPIAAAAVAPDGQTAATGSLDGTARTWTLGRIRPGPRATLPHPAAVQAVAYLPDGKSLVTACADGRVRVWDLTALKPAVRAEFAASVRVLAVTGDAIVGTAEGAAVTTWDARTGAVRAVWEVPGGSGTAAALTADGRYLARGTSAGVVGVYRVAEKRAR